MLTESVKIRAVSIDIYCNNIFKYQNRNVIDVYLNLEKAPKL